MPSSSTFLLRPFQGAACWPSGEQTLSASMIGAAARWASADWHLLTRTLALFVKMTRLNSPLMTKPGVERWNGLTACLYD